MNPLLLIPAMIIGGGIIGPLFVYLDRAHQRRQHRLVALEAFIKDYPRKTIIEPRDDVALPNISTPGPRPSTLSCERGPCPMEEIPGGYQCIRCGATIDEPREVYEDKTQPIRADEL